MKRLVFAGTCIVLVLGFFAAANYYRGQRAEDLGDLARDNSTVFVRPHSPVLGSPEARVQIVKFTDPACETCASFAPYMQQALEAYPGRVQVVIRYAPFHRGSEGVVRILEAARMQGKFEETLELLYQTQASWTLNHTVVLAKVWAIVPRAGIDVEQARRDVTDERITTLIAQDRADGETLGVRKTPGFFVNGKPLEPFGARPLAALIRAELAAQYPE